MVDQGSPKDFPMLDESGETLRDLRRTVTDRCIGIVISSSDNLFRDGLVALVGQWDEFCLFGVADSIEDARQLCMETEFSVCIIDTAINQESLDAIKSLSESAPFAKIVILSASGTDDDIIEALRAGIHGYCIRENIAADRIRGMIWGIVSGAVMVYGLERSKLAAPARTSHAGAEGRNSQDDKAAIAIEALSKRETEVLALLAQGLTNAEIGERLYLSEATIKKNIARIIAKLQVENRIQAAVLASKYMA